jgi:hypothetical protein
MQWPSLLALGAVVHGRPTEVDELEGDRLMNHLTIIPGPKYAAAAQQLQVLLGLALAQPRIHLHQLVSAPCGSCAVTLSPQCSYSWHHEWHVGK